MTNSGPFVPIIPAEAVEGDNEDAPKLILGKNVGRDEKLDDGETSDSQDTVNEDLHEGDDVNQNLSE